MRRAALIVLAASALAGCTRLVELVPSQTDASTRAGDGLVVDAAPPVDGSFDAALDGNVDATTPDAP